MKRILFGLIAALVVSDAAADICNGIITGNSVTDAQIVNCVKQPGSFTYATLPSAFSVKPGTVAYTTDQGNVVSTGTAWIAIAPGAAFPNANNGATETIKPQATTGLNSNSGNWIVDTASGVFSGNIFNDPVIAVGYNVDAQNGVKATTPDPFAVGIWNEAEYSYGTGAANSQGTVTASGSNSTTVLVDSGKTWNVNQWAQWDLYNSTSGGRCLITSNTATAITCTSAMVISDGVTAARANQTGDSYNTQIRQTEQYFEVYQSTTGGQNRRTRPIQTYLDKSTMAAQGLLASAGIQSLSAATAGASPTPFTSTLANHGLPAGTNSYVRFLGMTGGTWANLNGKQWPATVTGANTFTIPVNTTGFGTFSSGSFVVEPIMSTVNPPSVTIEPFSSGLQLTLPSWVGTNGTLTDTGAASDVAYQYLDSKMTQYGRQGVNSNNATMQIIADTGGLPTFAGWTGGGTPLQLFQLVGNENSTSLEIDTYTTSGTGAAPTLSIYRPNTTDVAMTLGSSNQGYVQGLANITNQNQTASRSLVNLRGATSQTGDYLDIWDSATGNTTKIVKIDSSGNYSGPSNISTGTTFTISSGTGACATTTTLTGGATVGSFVCTGTAGASTAVLGLPTAPHGWSCNASDVTSGVVWAQKAPVATNAATLSGTLTTTSDVVVFDCLGY